jgi:hypothetical protein
MDDFPLRREAAIKVSDEKLLKLGWKAGGTVKTKKNHDKAPATPSAVTPTKVKVKQAPGLAGGPRAGAP